MTVPAHTPPNHPQPTRETAGKLALKVAPRWKAMAPMVRERGK